MEWDEECKHYDDEVGVNNKQYTDKTDSESSHSPDFSFSKMNTDKFPSVTGYVDNKLSQISGKWGTGKHETDQLLEYSLGKMESDQNRWAGIAGALKVRLKDFDLTSDI